jgi:hypothetical protein
MCESFDCLFKSGESGLNLFQETKKPAQHWQIITGKKVVNHSRTQLNDALIASYAGLN